MKTSLLVYIFIMTTGWRLTSSYSAKFTNVECHEYDKEFAGIKDCHLKVVGRGKTAIYIHIRLLKIPVTNITMNAQLFRKSYDYRPFLYNVSMDFCKFLQNGNKFLFWKILLNIARPYTNVNHTCPYKHDIILKGLVLDERAMQLIPFATGDYMIQLHVFVKNSLKGRVKIYFNINENKS